MKAWSRPLAALALALALTLSLLLSSWNAEARHLTESRSLSASNTASSSSQVAKDLQLQADMKQPSKQVESSFRRIPPSGSNPIQNKFNPPSDGC